MARTDSLSNFLTDVADAIREKKNSEAEISAEDFDTEILNLPAGGRYQQKSVSILQNGQTVLTPDSGYDAIDRVEITVNVPIKQLQTKTLTVASNGNVVILPDTGYDGFEELDLQVQVPSTINNQNKTITVNGTYTADLGYTGLGEVTVNVQSGQLPDLPISTVASIEYDTFSYQPAVLDISIDSTLGIDLSNIEVAWFGSDSDNPAYWTSNNGISGSTEFITNGSSNGILRITVNDYTISYGKIHIKIHKAGYNNWERDITVTRKVYSYAQVLFNLRDTNSNVITYIDLSRIQIINKGTGNVITPRRLAIIDPVFPEQYHFVLELEMPTEDSLNFGINYVYDGTSTEWAESWLSQPGELSKMDVYIPETGLCLNRLGSNCNRQLLYFSKITISSVY